MQGTGLGVIVQKYGGSSVADADRIRQVAEKVARTRASGKHVVVVVSAMGDTTDELLGLAGRVSRISLLIDESGVDEAVRALHRELLEPFA
jgi:aspartokinase